jgi:hypothetical protein
LVSSFLFSSKTKGSPRFEDAMNMNLVASNQLSLGSIPGDKVPVRRDTETSIDMSELNFSEFSISQEEPDEDDQELDSLIDKITKEVMMKMLKESEVEGSAATGSIIDVKKVAELVAASVDKVKAGHGFLGIPKDSIRGVDSCEKTTGSSSQSTASRTSFSSQKSDPSSEGVNHPDFWCTDILDDEVGDGELLALLSGSSDGRSVSSGSFSATSLNDDDCSQMSDISCLTSVFSKEDALIKNRKSATTAVVPEKKSTVQFAPEKESTVRFGRIVVREYEQILGDNPACTSGPSLSIGWKYNEHPSLKVDDFESVRKRVRRLQGLVLSRKRREKILTNLGYSESEIAAGVRHVNKVRTQRKQTTNNLGIDATGAAIQSATRKMMGFLSKSKAGRR